MKLAWMGFFAMTMAAASFAAEAPSSEAGPMLRFTATTANVTGAPDSIRIDLFRWSTDAERDKLMAAWELKPGAVTSRGGGRGAGRGGAGRSGGRGGGAPAGRGRGGAARSETPVAAPTPEGQLALALKEASTIGYLWSSEAAGYAVRYAAKLALPDGTERVILITDRRLGEANGLWRAANQTAPAPYDFSILELRVSSKGTGEGKLSLGERVAPDDAAGMVALVNYGSLPVVFTGLKQTTPAARANRAKQ